MRKLASAIIISWMLLILLGSPVSAATSQNVTVTASPNYGVLSPTDFEVVRLDENTVEVSWTLRGDGGYVVIIAALEEYPDTYSGVEAAYTGNGTSTYLPWPVDTMPIYLSAWGYDGVSEYSTDTAEARTGGDLLDDIADAIGSITPFLGLVQLVPLIFLSAFAFWKENAVIFVICFALAYIAGLNAPDIISGNYETTTLGLAVGLALILYSYVCAAFAIRLIFWRDERGEE